MRSTQIIKMGIQSGKFSKILSYLYTESEVKKQQKRYFQAIDEFEKIFGKRDVAIFSAPGRAEIGGNHTDHQHGRVLAASINLDIIAVVALNNDNTIRVKSAGYNMDAIGLSDLSIREDEIDHASSLIRGCAARFNQLGYNIGGFDAYTTSDVLKGSGLSSSAAFEVAIGTILNGLFNESKISPVEIAQISQYAENVYFDKPSGLLDQTAASVGGFVTVDFKDPAHPIVETVDFDFAKSGYKLCVVDTKGNHSDLTSAYASIPQEMKSVASLFDKEILRDVEPEEFYKNISFVRERTGDRNVIRAIHFFNENDRVLGQVKALRERDFDTFKSLIIASGRSSYMYLQNVFCEPTEQGLSIALAMSEEILSGKGAWRVHGGGFAGTIQAFVPECLLEIYKQQMERIFGENSCYILSVRPIGGLEIKED